MHKTFDDMGDYFLLRANKQPHSNFRYDFSSVKKDKYLCLKLFII